MTAPASHPITGYPLLDQADDADAVVRVLAGDPPTKTCADCAHQRGGPHGAPFADGESSTWMSPRCDLRYVDLMFRCYRYDAAREVFEWTHNDRPECGCPPGSDERPDGCRPWWHTHYPHMTYRLPDYPACVHWRSRDDDPPTIADQIATLGLNLR